jgi:delta 1-pyrroline-5-carboxylate dehydrogenase
VSADAVDDVGEGVLAGVTASIERVPLGVVASIVPWNGPISMSSVSFPATLLAGCTVVLKPLELSWRRSLAVDGGSGTSRGHVRKCVGQVIGGAAEWASCRDVAAVVQVRCAT